MMHARIAAIDKERLLNAHEGDIVSWGKKKPGGTSVKKSHRN